MGLRVGTGPGLACPGSPSGRARSASSPGGGCRSHETAVTVPVFDAPGELAPELAVRAAALIGAAAQSAGLPLPSLSHPSFLEHMHLEEGRTTFPGTGTESRHELEAQLV